MTIVDKGRVGPIYRTVVACDADGCGVTMHIDADRVFIDEPPAGVTGHEVREQQLAAFLRGAGGKVVATGDGVQRFFCKDHLSLGE